MRCLLSVERNHASNSKRVYLYRGGISRLKHDQHDTEAYTRPMA